MENNQQIQAIFSAPKSPPNNKENPSTSGRVTMASKPYPPGYRFVPRDDELIVEYLMKKINNQSIPIDEINDVILSGHNPQDLADGYPQLGENEWYFFTPRDRKYRNGTRPDRAAGDGYWKATGSDKPISFEEKIVGFKKSLVFYEGKPPKGTKSNWIMHEYRVNQPPRTKRNALDMKLDDWVLCRIYKKAARAKDNNEEVVDPVNNQSPLQVCQVEEEEEEKEGLSDDNHGNVAIVDTTIVDYNNHNVALDEHYHDNNNNINIHQPLEKMLYALGDHDLPLSSLLEDPVYQEGGFDDYTSYIVDPPQQEDVKACSFPVANNGILASYNQQNHGEMQNHGTLETRLNNTRTFGSVGITKNIEASVCCLGTHYHDRTLGTMMSTQNHGTCGYMGMQNHHGSTADTHHNHGTNWGSDYWNILQNQEFIQQVVPPSSNPFVGSSMKAENYDYLDCYPLTPKKQRRHY